jgi:DNA-binding beta-propeller fold protein YncE
VPHRARSLFYVSDGKGDRVLAVDPADGQIVKTIAAGRGPEGLQIAPDCKTAYIANERAGSVDVIVVGTWKTAKSIQVGLRTAGIAVHPDGSRGCATNGGAGTVTVSTPGRTGRSPPCRSASGPGTWH